MVTTYIFDWMSNGEKVVLYNNDMHLKCISIYRAYVSLDYDKESIRYYAN